MAIQKNKTLRTGVTGNYWKITHESYDRLAGTLSLTISLFLNKSASDAGASPLPCSKTFKVPVTKEEMTEDRTAMGYIKIKEKAATVVAVPFALTPSTCLFDADLADGEDV